MPDPTTLSSLEADAIQRLNDKWGVASWERDPLTDLLLVTLDDGDVYEVSDEGDTELVG